MRRISTRNLTRVLVAIVLFLSAASMAALWASEDPPKPTAPLMRYAEPFEAKAGEIVTVHGEALDSSKVLNVYLSLKGKDTKLEIVEQTDTAIKVRIPANFAPGRYQFVVLFLTGDMFIEQPCYLRVVTERTEPVS